MSQRSRPKLADVAERAGVSLKTASRALNGEYGVAPATQERVLAAARALGFRPNLLARSLASGRASAAIGLIISNVADPFFAELIGGVEHVLGARDLQLVIASHHDDAERQLKLVRALVERRVDALLITPAPGNGSHLRNDIQHGLVVVALDRPLVGVDVDTVIVENRTGSSEAVRELVAAGHRRIAALANDPRLWTMQERIAGYRLALAEAGIEEDPAIVLLDGGDSRASQRRIAEMLDLPDPPTAIFAAHNATGRDAIRAMRAAALELPLVVFDEESDPDLLVPPPLVIQSDPTRLGRVAAEMALERLDGLAGPARLVIHPVGRLDVARALAT
ncbi:MAG: LacI family transcriptional regulator [Gaiellales bacterium]|jgi:LacI family transcriptional regulator|nr:LacI family transcriptional regulator [Gaiellales bacterium]